MVHILYLGECSSVELVFLSNRHAMNIKWLSEVNVI